MSRKTKRIKGNKMRIPMSIKLDELKHVKDLPCTDGDGGSSFIGDGGSAGISPGGGGGCK